MITIKDKLGNLPTVSVVDTYSESSGLGQLQLHQEGGRMVKLSRLMVDELIKYLLPSEKYHELSICDQQCPHGERGHDWKSAVQNINARTMA